MQKNPLVLLLLVLFGGGLPGFCAETPKTDTTQPVIFIDALGGNKSEIPCWEPGLGQGISEMLIETLENPGHKFQVLEMPDNTAAPKEESETTKTNSTSAGTKAGTSSSSPAKKSTKGGATNSGKTAPSSTTSPETSGGSEKPAADPATDISTNADFMLCGEVTQFMTQTNGGSIGQIFSTSRFANFGAKVLMAHVEIQWRIVDPATKKVIKRGITTCSAPGSEFVVPDSASSDLSGGMKAATVEATTNLVTTAVAKKKPGFFNNIYNGFFSNSPAAGNGSNNATSAKNNGGTTAKATAAAAKTGGSGESGDGGEIYDYGNPAFMNSALGKATCKAITNIIEQLDTMSLPESARAAKSATEALKSTSGTVLAFVNKDTVIVSLGSKEGFKEGDKLELYKTDEIKDADGKVVYTDETLAAEITLSSVQTDRSRGACADDTKIEKGWTVRAK